MESISPEIERRLKHLKKKTKILDDVYKCIELADE